MKTNYALWLAIFSWVNLAAMIWLAVLGVVEYSAPVGLAILIFLVMAVFSSAVVAARKERE